MLTGRQIKAARALLEWSGADLAEKTGLTPTTISNIESDRVQPYEGTLKSIYDVFDKHGVEFMPGEGVRIRQNEMRVFSGKAGYRQMLDHIYETVKGGGRICQLTSESNYLPLADDYAAVHLERMARISNLEGRVLTMEGDANFPASYCEYRWLPKEFDILAPFYVYNDYVVFSLHEASNKRELASINSKLLAERYVEQFNYFWKKSAVPKKSKGKFKI